MGYPKQVVLIINHSKSSENKILFKVNNEIITSLDILNEIQYLQIINKEFQDITSVPKKGL